jgi:FKBP-type peptidyl-prolyl cis-trans isomerase
MRKVLAGLLVPSMLVLSACGSDDGSDSGSESEGGATTAADCIEDAAAGGGDSGTGKPGPVTQASATGVTVTGDPGSEPTVKIATPLEVAETEVVVRAKGDGQPVPDDATVSVQYAGYNGRTGKSFDSSWERGGEPASFSLDGVIAGFSKAIAGQPVGSQVVVAMTPDDGYGPAGGNESAGIKAEDPLVFVIDILEYSTVLESAAGTVQEAPEDVPALQLNEECVPTGFEAGAEVPDEVTESSATTLVEGNGPKVEKGQQVTVHYLGQFYPEGKIFDQSWERGQPATFGIGVQQVIGCWDDLVPGATVGSRLELVCTPDDAYGDEDYNGIPGGSTLTFVVDILAAQ